MYWCACVSVYICMSEYTHVRVHSMCVCMYVCMYWYACVRACVSVYIYYIYAWIYVCTCTVHSMYVCMYVCTCQVGLGHGGAFDNRLDPRGPTYTHVYMPTYARTCMYVRLIQSACMSPCVIEADGQPDQTTKQTQTGWMIEGDGEGIHCAYTKYRF